MKAITNEIERLGAQILASESWTKQYNKTPAIHAKLIKTETKLETKIRKYFHDLAPKVVAGTNWYAYMAQAQQNKTSVQAAGTSPDPTIEVIVNDQPVDDSTKEFIQLVLEPITAATALGAQSGDELYPYQLGLDTTDATIRKVALDHSARLVGKTVMPDGSIVDNTLKGLDITEKTRADIRQSIHNSIVMGRTVGEAQADLLDVIDSPTRAELIARTEIVNSFGQGLTEYGKQTNAIGKEWQDAGATDECADNTGAGVIPFDDTFPSGDDEPTAHPNCRCSMRLVYQNELDDNPDLFNGDG